MPVEELTFTDTVPESAPTVHVHRDHTIRLGTPLDEETAVPIGCRCATCQAVERLAAERRREAAAAERHRLAVRVRQSELARGGAVACRTCALNHRQICPTCHRCTWRGSTVQNLLDEHFILFGNRSSDRTAEAVRDHPPSELLDQTTASGYITSCCGCRICPTCNVNLAGPADPERRVCISGHHVGCNCTCWTCGNCGSLRSRAPANATTACETCDGIVGCCCHCRRCRGCQDMMPSSGVVGAYGDLVSNRCQTCEMCVSRCCTCIPSEGSRMPDAGDAVGGRVVFQRAIMKKWPPSPSWGLVEAGLAKKDERNPYSRLIGAEIECGGNGTTGLNKVVVRNWKGAIVSDGSLPSSGFEINTAPAAGDMWVKQITEIAEEFKRTKVWANSQCGLHIHVDTSDFRIWDMRRLINIYRRVEDAMFELLPQSRRTNTYCVPCGDTWWKVFNDPGKIRELKGRQTKGGINTSASPAQLTSNFKGKVTTAMYGLNPNLEKAEKRRQEIVKEMKRQKSNKGNDLRYRALNVHSWFLRGTLEFRHGSPALGILGRESREPITADYIINWGITCAAVVEAARKMSDAQVDGYRDPKTGKQVPGLKGGMGTLLELLPSDSLREWAKDTQEKLKTLNRTAPPSDEDDYHEDDCDCSRCEP